MRRRRTSRDVYGKRASNELSKLAWQASRSNGGAALAVLQDALMQTYPSELADAQKHARKMEKSKRRGVVIVFVPTEERAIRRAQKAERTDTLKWYRRHHWPFNVVTESFAIHRLRPTAVIIWSSETGWVKGEFWQRVRNQAHIRRR